MIRACACIAFGIPTGVVLFLAVATALNLFVDTNASW